MPAIAPYTARRFTAADRIAIARIPPSLASTDRGLSQRSIDIDPRCQKGHYYLLNNYNPGYFGNGKNAYIDQNPANTPFHDSTLFNAQHRRRPER